MSAWLILRKFHALAACRRGVTALEFAFVAPMLFFGTFAMVDVGIGIAGKMEMDRNVRSGVQAAISLDRNALDIKGIVEIAAGQPSPTVTVETECACGEIVVTCGTSCSSGDLPSVYYAISASRPQSGFILPDRTINSSVRVQVR